MSNLIGNKEFKEFEEFEERSQESGGVLGPHRPFSRIENRGFHITNGRNPSRRRGTPPGSWMLAPDSSP
jgi:hypothetical protein